MFRRLLGWLGWVLRLAKKRKVYVADFETTTDPDDCRVWGWGLVEVGEHVTIDDVEVSTDIVSFVDRVSEEASIVYFHNLAFDATFIMDWLLKEGYRHVEEYARPGEFETLISSTGQHYSVTVRWVNGGRTEFRDSLKKLPMSVDRIARSFNLPMSKLEIDYHETRPVGHVLTPHEVEYIAADVVIVAMALWIQLSQDMKKLTVGSDSLHEFKNLFGHKRFVRTFPIIHKEIDADIRKAYRGGWTYLKEEHKGKVIGAGSVYDVNSLYPSVMWNAEMPYGEPRWFNGGPENAHYPLYVVSVTFTAKLRPGFLPCIQIKAHSIFNPTDYVSAIDEPLTLVATNVDLELWQRHYDMDILSYNGGWSFQKCTGVFDEYIHKWTTIKNESEGGLREIAKLHLNSLYGKFATNPLVQGKYPILENGAVVLKLGPEEYRDPVYTPVGVFITAYARRVTIEAGQANYDRFIYADTDSLHLLGTEPPAGIKVDPHELGAWKHEYDFFVARFLRSKRYMELEWTGADGGWFVRHTHIAGLPKNVASTLTISDFKMGNTFGGKLLPQRVPGGIVLTETTYSLN